MNNPKRIIDKSIPYILLLSLLLANILLTTGIMKMFYGWDTTLIAGVIAFVGAIIGGTITLVGVQATIKHNEKMKRREELPNKLNSLENAVDALEKITEKDLIFNNGDPYDNKNNFISIDSHFNCERSDLYEKYTAEVPNVLKSKFIFIDSEAYRMYLEFKEKLFKLESIFTTEEIMLMDFREKIEVELEESIYTGEYIVRHKEFDANLTEDFLKLKSLFNQKDRELTYNLQQIYIDLYLQLILKHERLIEQLDY